MTAIPGEFAAAVKTKLDLFDDLTAFTSADRDDDGGFKNTFFAFGKNVFIIAEGGRVKSKTFRGFTNKMRLQQTNESINYDECSFSSMPIEQIDSLQVINLVSGGRLTYIKDGVQTALCAFSNAKAKDVGAFVMLFNKYKNKGELTEDDLKQSASKEACPKCGMLYPDPSQPICPNCNKKGATALRILKIAKPYRLLMITVYFVKI